MNEQKNSQPWHVLPIAQVLKDLAVDPLIGLSSTEVQKRATQFGPNQLREDKKISPFALLFEQFTDFIVLTLIASAIVSGFLGEWISAIAIIAIVILNAILGFFQEYRAEKALSALKQLSAPTAQVTRDGESNCIPSIGLVPGDIIHLRSGDLVPADARIVDAHMLLIDEATLTGESLAVEKTCADSIPEDAGVADQINMAHAGTVVVRGRGQAVVTTTGMKTELGHIAGMVQAIEEEETPLQKRLDQVGRLIVYISFAVVGIIFIVGVLRGDNWIKMFLVAVSLAVAAVPEGLAAVVTIALALGMHRMVKRNALIRKLPAVETLGAATFICTDKTGTLTENAMTVREIIFPDSIVTVTGEGYSSEGHFRVDGKPIDANQNPSLELALKIGALCNTTQIVATQGNDYRIVGDPTEGALLIAAEKAHLLEHIEREYDFVAELPFDATRKRMTTIQASTQDGKQTAFVKGALISVLPLCNQVYRGDKVCDIDEATREQIMASNTKLASQARRVLALAYREYNDAEAHSIESVEKDLIFVALVGMIDPPRPETKQAVTQARNAGIQVAMITGDQAATAIAVAREVGIVQSEQAVLLCDCVGVAFSDTVVT